MSALACTLTRFIGFLSIAVCGSHGPNFVRGVPGRLITAPFFAALTSKVEHSTSSSWILFSYPSIVVELQGFQSINMKFPRKVGYLTDICRLPPPIWFLYDPLCWIYLSPVPSNGHLCNPVPIQPWNYLPSSACIMYPIRLVVAESLQFFELWPAVKYKLRTAHLYSGSTIMSSLSLSEMLALLFGKKKYDFEPCRRLTHKLWQLGALERPTSILQGFRKQRMNF